MNIILAVFVSSIVGVVVLLRHRKAVKGNHKAAPVLAAKDPISPASVSGTIPVSVNYFLTRQCNYSCGFCFHTAKTSYVLPLEKAMEGLTLLRKAGMKKLNFAGGEPLLEANFVGELSKFCKLDLGLESISIVTNGSQVKKLSKSRFFERYGKYIDIIAVSCDSFLESTNVAIGRGSGAHVDSLHQLRDECEEHGIRFKINTVVNRLNFKEDMREEMKSLAPFRWKVFQVLIVKGENDTDQTL